MDLDWCIVCDRHTSGGIYCSKECRDRDTPQELLGKSPIVPGPLDVKKLAVPVGSDFLFFKRSNQSYLNDDEDENKPTGYKNAPIDVFVSFGPLTNESNNNISNSNRQSRTQNNNNNNNIFNIETQNKKRIYPTSKFYHSNIRAF